MNKKFRWVVEMEVDETWVADGFNLTNDRAQELMQQILPWSYSHETTAKVLEAPPIEEIMRVQGYSQTEIDMAQAKHVMSNEDINI